MKRYVGFGWSCGSFAVENAVKKLPVSAEQYEMLGGVPFGLKNDKNTIITLTDPFDGIMRAAENLAVFVERKSFIEFSPFWSNLLEDADNKNRSIVLGPVNMQKLFYIPFSSFYSDVDHYLALEAMNENEMYITDSDGFIQIKVLKEQAIKMLDTEGKFNQAINYSYYAIGNKFPILDSYQMIYRARKTIRENFKEASKKQPFLETMMYIHDTLNAKDVNNMLFNTNSLMYRKQLQKDFVEWAGALGFRGLDKAISMLEEQIALIALQKYNLKVYGKQNRLWEWERLQELEDGISDIFIEN